MPLNVPVYRKSLSLEFSPSLSSNRFKMTLIRMRSLFGIDVQMMNYTESHLFDRFSILANARTAVNISITFWYSYRHSHMKRLLLKFLNKFNFYSLNSKQWTRSLTSCPRGSPCSTWNYFSCNGRTLLLPAV